MATGGVCRTEQPRHCNSPEARPSAHSIGAGNIAASTTRAPARPRRQCRAVRIITACWDCPLQIGAVSENGSQSTSALFERRTSRGKSEAGAGNPQCPGARGGSPGRQPATGKVSGDADARATQPAGADHECGRAAVTARREADPRGSARNHAPPGSATWCEWSTICFTCRG